MSNEKKSSTLSIRLEPKLVGRLEKLEAATKRSRGDLVRQALDAILKAFEANGRLDFPIEVSSVSASAAKELVGEKWNDLVSQVADQVAAKLIQGQELPRTLQLVAPEENSPPSSLPPSNVIRGHWIDLAGGVAAGSPIASDCRAEPIQGEKEYPEDCYALKVFGRSMEPKIHDQSTIIVQPWHGKGFPKKGKVIVYSDGSGSTLKEFGYRKAKPGEESDSMGNVPVLKSTNKDFPNVQTMEGGRIDAVLVDVM